MNCSECRENLTAYIECLLDPETTAACRSHLECCASCREEEHAVTGLHERLQERGQAGSEVSLVAPVMRRIQESQSTGAGRSPSLAAFLKWGLGFGAAAATAVVAISVFMSVQSPATAADVLARGAKVMRRLTGVHLTARVRSSPGDNFSNLSPELDFTTIQVWKEFRGRSRWRVEKPGRVAVMNGESTELFISYLNEVSQVPPTPGKYLPLPAATKLPGGPEVPAGWAPFDTGWLHALANIEDTLNWELDNALENDWPMNMSHDRDETGRPLTVVSIEARSGLPEGDYLQNKFFRTSDTLREYTFDAETWFLEEMRVFLHEPEGDVLVIEVDRIELDPAMDDQVFVLDLPEGVVRDTVPGESLPADPKYSDLTSEEAARDFFEACAREDWDEAAEFWTSPMKPWFTNYLGGLTIIELGESFTSAAYPGRFVPYEIQRRGGTVKKHNLALKRDRRTQRWYVDGGI